jgi:hypothetical protein
MATPSADSNGMLNSPATEQSIPTDPYAALAAVLWSEREVLETVLYALTQERLILAAGETRWLHRADAQLRAALDRLRTAEVMRAAELDALTDELRLPHETTLAELVSIAPEPWPLVLDEHRAALRDLAAEIDRAGGQLRGTLSAGAAAIAETLEGLAGLGGAESAPAGYTATGAAAGFTLPPLLFDEQA